MGSKIGIPVLVYDRKTFDTTSTRNVPIEKKIIDWRHIRITKDRVGLTVTLLNESIDQHYHEIETHIYASYNRVIVLRK